MKLNYDIEPLDDNQIAGAKTINPIIKYILGMDSTSDFLAINPNGRGSVNFDLDAGALAKWILSMIDDNTGLNLEWDFKVNFTKSGSSNRISVRAGQVFFPDNSVSISGINNQSISSSSSGKMVYVRLNSKSSGELVIDNAVTHTLQTGNDNYRMTLPIATITYKSSNNTWSARYHHIGSFSFGSYPYFWKDNFTKGDYQFLVHRNGQNEERWVSAGDCSSEGN